MAGKDLTYTVGVDASDATSGLRRLESAVRSTMRTVDDELEDGATAGEKLAASLDRVAAQAKEDLNSAAIAAQELQDALRRAGSSMDVGDALSSLKRMGVSFDEITADADKLAVSLKQLDDVRATGVADLDSIAPGLATKLDDVTKSAGSSKSALANMVGNSAQDLGELGGISGSVGVAVGQMAEYFADASFEGENLGSVLKSFAGVAGPIAAIGLATKLIGDAMKAQARSSEVAADNVERFTEAVRDGGDVAENYAEALEETGEVLVKTGQAAGPAWADILPGGSELTRGLQMLGVFGDELEDITTLLQRAGIDSELWARIITTDEPVAAMDRLRASLEKTNLSDSERADILIAARSEQDNYAQGVQNAAIQTEFWGEKADEATISAEDLAAAQEEAAQAARDHAIAIAGAAGELADIGSVFADMERRGSALSSVFDLGNAPLDAASATRDIAEGIAGLAETAKDVNVGDILAGNMDGDAVLDALDALRPEIQSKIKDAFAAGGPEAAQQTADWYVESVYKALDGKLSREQVAELLNLGDLEAEIAIATKLSDVERVKRQLEVLTGVSGESPLTASIALALDAGTITPEAAELLVQAQLGQAGVTVPSTLATPDTKAARTEAAAFVMDLPTTLNTRGAKEDATAFSREVERTPVTAPLDADAGDAEDEVEGFRRKTESTEPVVPVLSDTARALATMKLLTFAAAILSPEVTVTANTAPAMLALAGVASQRPRVPVDVYVDDYPSRTEIERMIGRPRIPVDIVVGSSIRITGVRE